MNGQGTGITLNGSFSIELGEDDIGAIAEGVAKRLPKKDFAKGLLVLPEFQESVGAALVNSLTDEVYGERILQALTKAVVIHMEKAGKD